VKLRCEKLGGYIVNKYKTENEAGDSLEIIGFEPELPATFFPKHPREGGLKTAVLKIKIAYQLQSAESCYIFAHPSVPNDRTGCFSSPSPLYKKGSGELIAWFGFDREAHVEQVEVKMIGEDKTDKTCSVSNEPFLTLIADVEADWSF